MMLPVIIKEQSFGTPFSFVITGSRPNHTYTSFIGFRLRMDFRIPIYLTGACLKNFYLQAFSQAQHIDGAYYTRFGGLNRVKLIVDRAGRAGEVVYFIHLRI